jgi:hypothetical protein
MGIQVEFPYPLRNCPGRERWSRHANSEYTVFIDESEQRFFGLDYRFGYFCHAAVGIPSLEYDNVRTACQPIFERYREIVGARETEFKYGEFRRIVYTDRRDLAARIAKVLRDTGSFVAGFFTPTEPYILEQVRWDLLGEADALPDAPQGLYAAAADRLRAKEKGPGNATLIANLLDLPVQAVANLLSAFGCRYRTIYDPRQKREDKAVAGLIEGYIKAAQEADVAQAPFLGLSADRTSDQEIGLQLADLLAGEVRDFFGTNIALLSFGARRELITPWSDEPIQAMVKIGGIVGKSGVLATMPAELRRAFHERDQSEASVFSEFTDLLASGILTCYSSTGTPRDLLIYEDSLWDQADLDRWALSMMLRAQAMRKQPPWT